ncbi:hypothetical protein ACPA0F_20240 [Solibacillus silvestris]
MTEHFSFFDAIQDSNGHYDREYNAQQFTDYFKSLVTTGVMKGAYNQLEVTANGSNMTSSVKSGVAFVEGRYYYNDALLQLTHDTEVLGLSRIDRIVVRMDLSTEARYVKTFIKKGVPSTNPIVPTLTQTQQLYEISLAQVRVVGGQTFISSSAVTDERGKDIICPWTGSKILPNFNNDELEDLINGVTFSNEYDLTLTNGVAGYFKFRINGQGMVYFRFSLQNLKNNTSIGFLPVGFRPTEILTVPMDISIPGFNGTILHLHSNGNVRPFYASGEIQNYDSFPYQGSGFFMVSK